MKLLASPTSPYARLVRVVIHEKHLDGTVSCEWVDPWASPGSLLAANPFSRVPTLLADDGEVLTESLLIALYLDQRFPEPVLVPAGSRARIYRKLGLANGLIDAAVAVVAARRFGYEKPDRDPVRRRLDSLRRGMAMLDSDAADARTPDLGDLALAIGLAYLDFRLPEFGWRDLASALAEWYRVVEQRPSLQHTRPPA
ncbi:MAG: glutathione S-transferase N-terminal domain-containing protein [Gammaproteobacteria bacterium]|nr:glutathione S-transferase N-terminal domain-containing protein [Gammaproteobacteria bacterium]